ncbi:MAG TPA: ABC transporter ATP-binding protein [bacterium]|nr:ABC transporter ATP-binding protein [bacterium]
MSSATAVEISGFTKRYGRLTAVDNLSLSAGRGQIVALVGPDGSGKTTLFRATCGLITFDAGTISIVGLDITRDFEKVKLRLGYMPQVFSLYQDLSVEENLGFYAGLFGVDRPTLTRKQEVLYQFSGLGPFRRRRAGQLSGGMKQKLSLCCALVHDPEVFILDEPTAGVDPVSRQQFWDILKDLKSHGSTILISTPYMDEVAMADRAIFIYGGKVLASGTPQELAGEFKGRVYRLRVAPNAQELAEVGRIPGLSVRRFGTSAYIYTDGGRAIDTYYDRLGVLGIRSEALEEVPASLEDAFVQLMGR